MKCEYKYKSLDGVCYFPTYWMASRGYIGSPVAHFCGKDSFIFFGAFQRTSDRKLCAHMCLMLHSFRKTNSSEILCIYFVRFAAQGFCQTHITLSIFKYLVLYLYLPSISNISCMKLVYTSPSLSSPRLRTKATRPVLS